MADQGPVSQVENLSDLELAMLLSLMSSQHAIIQTEADLLEDLGSELQLAARQTFGLRATKIRCSEDMGLDDFTQSLLVSNLPLAHSHDYSKNGETSIPNVLIVQDLHLTVRTVQIQAMELMKSRRIFTHTAVHQAPKTFLILAISATGSAELVNHLRDHVFLSHVHDAEAGFPNVLEGASSSMLAGGLPDDLKPLLAAHELDNLALKRKTIVVTVEVTRYIHDIVIFLRMHRAIAAGVSPLATQYFVDMCKSLAVLHDLGYVTPSLVVLAAKKVFRHRLVPVTPMTERSMQYGSDVTLVAATLKGVTPEAVIEDVLASVEGPL